jgi:uncharacterized membrane protein
MLLLLSTLLFVHPSDGWQDAGEHDGVEMWMRDVQGSNVREIKAQTLVDLPVERVWPVLEDVEKYPEFMPYMVEVKVLERPAPDVATVYQCIAPPVVEKRDSVVEVTRHVDERMGIYRTEWHSVDKGPAPRHDIVRVSGVRGQWLLERIGNRHTRLTYTMFTEPGGSVPGWIVNRANKRSAPKLLLAVTKRAAASI